MILNIRLATPSDIPAIQDLEKRADTAAHWSDETYQKLLVANAGERVVLVADHNGSVSGFLVVRAGQHEWELENVVVDLNIRRRGIASALIHNLVERAREADVEHIFLEVRQSNVSARSLYAKTGFVECGRRSRYYQKPEEDAICYRRAINSSQEGSPEL